MRTPQLLAAVLLSVATTATTSGTEPRPRSQAEAATPDQRAPHRLDTEVAAIIVRVRGGAICTGTPIAATTLVVTAAHCVLDDDGRVADSRTVLRDGVEHTARSVFVDLAYHTFPGPRLDAAVLVMDEVVPGPSAILGDELPTAGPVIVAGFQAIDTDGSLLRGTRVDNRPAPHGATGPIVRIDSAPAGCVLDRAVLTVEATRITAPCGLIPGASGGGLFARSGDDISLLGVISTVAADLTGNGLTPAAAIRELLAHPETYRHEMHRNPPESSRAHVNRS